VAILCCPGSLPAPSGIRGLDLATGEVRTPRGGFLFGRSTDTGGHIEGIHNQFESPAALLIDEAKTVAGDVLDTLSRCHTSYRSFMSSTGNASGGFYQIMTAKSHLLENFPVSSDMCPQVDRAEIAADRESLKDSVYRTCPFHTRLPCKVAPKYATCPFYLVFRDLPGAGPPWARDS
jgi:hypothetical protein